MMGNRLSKIYTRTGDDGTTGLGDGTRVPKDGERVEAYGTVDELNSAIGVLLAVPGLPAEVTACLTEVQHELFDMGGELCIPGHHVITAEHALRLEVALDGFNDSLPPLKEFILPGGTRLHAVLPPVAVRGTLISLRVPPRRAFTVDQLTASGMLAESTPIRTSSVRSCRQRAVPRSWSPARTSWYRAWAPL